MYVELKMLLEIDIEKTVIARLKTSISYGQEKWKKKKPSRKGEKVEEI